MWPLQTLPVRFKLHKPSVSLEEYAKNPNVSSVPSPYVALCEIRTATVSLSAMSKLTHRSPWKGQAAASTWWDCTSLTRHDTCTSPVTSWSPPATVRTSRYTFWRCFDHLAAVQDCCSLRNSALTIYLFSAIISCWHRRSSGTLHSVYSYRRVGTTYRSHLQGVDKLFRKVGNYKRCVTSQKSDDVIYTTA